MTGNQIAVADLIKSVSVLEYRPGAGDQNDELKEVARHVQVSWSMALAEVNENTYLQADAEGNLILLERDVSGVTEEDRRRLMLRGDMLLGEQVNRIRRIDMATVSDAPVVPRAFFATVRYTISHTTNTYANHNFQSGRGLHISLRPHRPFESRPAHPLAVGAGQIRQEPWRLPLPQLPRLQEPGPRGGRAEPLR